jgi:uncharacterized protein (DUF433 family)
MSATVNIGSLISCTPGLRGGRPCIAGTGVSVRTIAVWHQMGKSPEEIVSNYGHINLAQVHAALAYYHANQAKIDAEIADEEALYDRLVEESRQQPSRLSA